MCTITVDVSHGGAKNTGATDRANDRVKNRNKHNCNRFIQVGCGANGYNSYYISAGIGVRPQPPYRYPINDFPDNGYDDMFKKNGFEGNDSCRFTELGEHMDLAIMNAEREAESLFNSPCCCKSVKIAVVCTDLPGGHNGRMSKIEEDIQKLNGRKPRCGTTIEISPK